MFRESSAQEAVMRRIGLWLALVSLMILTSAGAASAGAPPPTCNGLTPTIIGTNGPDEIFGTEGNDVIVGLGGDDFILGGGGADTICGGSGDDFVIGQQGADQLFGENGNDIVLGGPGNDVVSGGNGNDILFGNFGNDSLWGGNGDDFLNGDLPFPADQSETPPGAHEDPNVNSDSCNGERGSDSATFCEAESSIELHPNPADVIFDV